MSRCNGMIIAQDESIVKCMDFYEVLAKVDVILKQHCPASHRVLRGISIKD